MAGERQPALRRQMIEPHRRHLQRGDLRRVAVALPACRGPEKSRPPRRSMPAIVLSSVAPAISSRMACSSSIGRVPPRPPSLATNFQTPAKIDISEPSSIEP